MPRNCEVEGLFGIRCRLKDECEVAHFLKKATPIGGKPMVERNISRALEFLNTNEGCPANNDLILSYAHELLELQKDYSSNEDQ